MSGPDPRLQPALARHRAGALAEAATLYGQILADRPDDADALHLLGVTRQQQGDFASSAALIERALSLRADAAFATNLANAYLGQGRFEDAARACRIALGLNAAFAMAHANLGVALQALGRLDEAAQSLRTAIAIDPGRPEPQSNLGVVLLSLGRRDESMAVLRGLIAVRPDFAQAHYNLGNAIAAVETPQTQAEALDCYDRAIALHPGYAEAHTNRGSILRRMGQGEAAEAAYRTALSLAPNSAMAHYNFGLLLGELGRPAEAAAEHQRAIELAPGLALAHSHLGNMLTVLERVEAAMAAHARALALAPNDPQIHHNLGLTLGHQALNAEAAAAQSRAIALKPDYAEAHAALAGCLKEMGQDQAALYEANRALALAPDLGMAHTALGQILMEMGDLAGARIALERALALRPTYAQSHLNLGVLAFREGREAEAGAAYEAALALRPETWEARYNLGIWLLQRGDYARGFADFERRLSAPERRRTDALYPQPLWMGEPLAGRTILLCWEQGLGDILQCLRFVPQVAALGATVFVEAQPALRRLIEAMPDVAGFVPAGAPCPQAQLRLPLFSLPDRLGITLEALPGPIPYLSIAPPVQAEWTERLAALTGPRVGIVWSGNVQSKVNRGRSIPLAAFAPLARAVGSPLISLQKQFGLEELADLPEGMAVRTLDADYDSGDLADTGAVLQNLDLLVACDTSVAHLAGSLGVPTWLAINRIPDWRWLRERTDSPWYPGHRLYRAPEADDWTRVVEAMAADWRAAQHSPPGG